MNTRRPAPRSAANTTKASWRSSGPGSHHRTTTGEAPMSSPAEPVHLNNHHRNTLRQLYRHPPSHNIEWHAVLSLLEAVGSVERHHDGKVAVTVGPQTAVFTPPAGKDIDTQTAAYLRRMLSAAGDGGEPEDSPRTAGRSAGS